MHINVMGYGNNADKHIKYLYVQFMGKISRSYLMGTILKCILSAIIKASKDSVMSFCHNCEGQVWLKHSLSLSDSRYLRQLSDVWHRSELYKLPCMVSDLSTLQSKILWTVFELSIDSNSLNIWPA